MPDDNPFQIGPVVAPGLLTLPDGRIVLSCEGDFYRVLQADGVTVHALPARTVASLEAAVADLVSSPPPPPPDPVAPVLSRTQFVIAARRVLGLTDDVAMKLIGQLPDAEVRATALDLWENADEFHRDNKVLLGLAKMGGYTADQLDKVFRTGAAPDLY